MLYRWPCYCQAAFWKVDCRLPFASGWPRDAGLSVASCCNQHQWSSVVQGGGLLPCRSLHCPGMNGYGNLLLLRDDRSLVQWLHVASILQAQLLRAGTRLMALLLSFVPLAARQREAIPACCRSGQTAFFLPAHGHYCSWQRSLGVLHQRGLPETFIAAAVVIGFLPCCRWYRGYKPIRTDGLDMFSFRGTARKPKEASP
jgi:hypothetical protein